MYLDPENFPVLFSPRLLKNKSYFRYATFKAKPKLGSADAKLDNIIKFNFKDLKILKF